LNRTPKSFLFAIVGAEYVLRWLPRGTHRWDRFLRPSEFAADLRRLGLEVRDLKGLVYDPLRDAWRVGQDLGVNYLVYAAKPAD
jgi:2-polyprenyl-6-hydroxyphenyl methylase/3-demethylubiquinone-9 3-methyltransferase